VSGRGRRVSRPLLVCRPRSHRGSVRLRLL